MYDISPNNKGKSGFEMEQLEERDYQQSQLDFQAEFLELLNPKSSEGRLIFAFIRARLKQFNIQRAYSEACILNEVYLRAIHKIKQGETIAIPHAWIRGTAYNHIRELSRDWHKFIHLENYQHYHRGSLEPEETENYLTSLMKREELKLEQSLIRQAFRELPFSEQQLLSLKVIRGLSWKQIQNLGEYKDCTLATLRKRKQRALEKLHHRYHFLSDSSEISSAKTPV